MKYCLIFLILLPYLALSQKELSETDKKVLNQEILNNRNKINILYKDLQKNKEEIASLIGLNLKYSGDLYGEHHPETCVATISNIDFLFAVGMKKKAFLHWTTLQKSIDRFVKEYKEKQNPISDRQSNILMAYWNQGAEIQNGVGGYREAYQIAKNYLAWFDYSNMEPSGVAIYNISRLYDYGAGNRKLTQEFINICEKFETYLQKCSNSNNVDIITNLVLCYKNLHLAHIDIGDEKSGESYYQKAYKLSDSFNLKEIKYEILSTRLSYHIKSLDKKQSEAILKILEKGFNEKSMELSKMRNLYSIKADYLEKFGDINEAILLRIKVADYYTKNRFLLRGNHRRSSLIALGKTLMKAEKYKDALNEFEYVRNKILEEDIIYYNTRNNELLTRIAECYIKLGNPVAAIKVLYDCKASLEHESKWHKENHDYSIFQINQKIASAYGEYSEFELAAKAYLQNLQFYKDKHLNNDLDYLINLGEAVKWLQVSNKSILGLESQELYELIKKDTYPDLSTEYFMILINNIISYGNENLAKNYFAALKDIHPQNKLRINTIEFLQALFLQEEGNYKSCMDALIELSNKDPENFSPSLITLINTSF